MKEADRRYAEELIESINLSYAKLHDLEKVEIKKENASEIGAFISGLLDEARKEQESAFMFRNKYRDLYFKNPTADDKIFYESFCLEVGRADVRILYLQGLHRKVISTLTSGIGNIPDDATEV